MTLFRLNDKKFHFSTFSLERLITIIERG